VIFWEESIPRILKTAFWHSVVLTGREERLKLGTSQIQVQSVTATPSCSVLEQQYGGSVKF